MLTLCIHKACVSSLPFFMCHVLVEAYCFCYSGVLHSNAFLEWKVIEELIAVLGLLLQDVYDCYCSYLGHFLQTLQAG